MGAKNGVGAFILQCKRLDFHYCDKWGSSRGMKYVQSYLYLYLYLPIYLSSVIATTIITTLSRFKSVFYPSHSPTPSPTYSFPKKNQSILNKPG